MQPIRRPNERPLAARPAGLGGARVTITAASKLGSHFDLVVQVLAKKRSRWWLAAGAASLAADVALIRKLADVDYRPGILSLAADALDASVWGIGAGPLPNAIAAVMVANALPSAIEAGFRFTAGTSALPVYDDRSPFPPRNIRESLPGLARLAGTITIPFVSTRLARRAVGYRTGPYNVAWGVAGATVGVVAARHRHLLQAQAKDTWLDRASERVGLERASARFQLMASSSPGHDFKKTLFALGLLGSDEAMRAALEQGSRPGSVLRSMVDRPLAEVAYRIPIDPPEQSLRLLTKEQASAVEEFLRAAVETAADGGDQVIRVDELRGFAVRLRYLESELILHDEPPRFVARLNPTAVAMCAAALLTAIEAGSPIGQSQSPLIMGPLLALELINLANAWSRPPTDDSVGGVIRLALVGCAVGVVAAGTRSAALTDRDGANAYPAFHSLRDLLMVMLPNWDLLRSKHKRIAGAMVAGALGASVFRRRHSGVDWLDLVAEFSIVTNAFSVFKLSSRVEEEGQLLEDTMFAWYASEVQSARRSGQEEELATYAEHLDLARRSLGQLTDLNPEDRYALELDCQVLAEWLDKAQAALDSSAIDSVE
jgi:hypothetical protein